MSSPKAGRPLLPKRQAPQRPRGGKAVPCAVCAQRTPPQVCLTARVTGVLAVALTVVGLVAFTLDLDLGTGAHGDRLGLAPEVLTMNDTSFVWDERPTTIATIALHGFDSRALVVSLRGPGEWTGDIVVIGDKCSPRPEGARFVLASNEIMDGADGALSRALASKYLKTRLLELGAPTPSSSVLYLDSDIEANRPVAPFLEALRRAQAARALAVRCTTILETAGEGVRTVPAPGFMRRRTLVTVLGVALVPGAGRRWGAMWACRATLLVMAVESYALATDPKCSLRLPAMISNQGRPRCDAWFSVERAWHRWKHGHYWQGERVAAGLFRAGCVYILQHV